MPAYKIKILNILDSKDNSTKVTYKILSSTDPLINIGVFALYSIFPHWIPNNYGDGPMCVVKDVESELWFYNINVSQGEIFYIEFRPTFVDQDNFQKVYKLFKNDSDS